MGLSLTDWKWEQELCPEFVKAAEKGCRWFRVSIIAPFKQACTPPIFGFWFDVICVVTSFLASRNEWTNRRFPGDELAMFPVQTLSGLVNRC